MFFRYHHFLALILLASLVSCDFESKNEATYIGGKIINPQSNFVVFSSTEKLIDTFYLDKEHKFLAKLDTFNEGLYHFKHGYEHQYIYLYPKDSITFRLNSWDFDESLVFSGKGAERNNLLIDCFIENETEGALFHQLIQLNPNQYKASVDSLLVIKNNTFNDFILNNSQETTGYKTILNIALKYSIYRRTEEYPMNHYRIKKADAFPEIATDFYDFRTETNINNDSLMYYVPYSNYVKSFLYNTTFSKGYHPNGNEFPPEFTVDLLKTIDENILSEKTKNMFLAQVTLRHFVLKSSCHINTKSFETFSKLSTNEKDKQFFKSILKDNKTLVKGQKIGGFKIKDLNNTPRAIEEVLNNKKSFLIFWNEENLSKGYIASKVKFLSRNFPEIQILQVQMNGKLNNRIQGLDIKTQFYIDSLSKANIFLTSKMSRSLLINEKGIVTNGNASISSRKIVEQLENFSRN